MQSMLDRVPRALPVRALILSSNLSPVVFLLFRSGRMSIERRSNRPRRTKQNEKRAPNG